jgi:hypothetical protein
MVKLIENFILNLNKIENKYNSRPLKAFLQSQTSKFLNHFHDDRKQRVANTLDNEQWKQVKSILFFNKYFLNKISFIGYRSSFNSNFC